MIKYAESTHEDKIYDTVMRATGVDCTPPLIGKSQICEITNAQRDLIIKELHLCFIVVERKELITKMKSMLVTNEHPNTKDESTRKLFDPELLTAAN